MVAECTYVLSQLHVAIAVHILVVGLKLAVHAARY